MLPGDRTILHCDCNSFYASVECVRDPSLREIPMAVCGDPENRRGVILAKNEPAKKRGVVTAETVWQARRKCPGLVLVPPHRNDYQDFSRRINAIYSAYTDLVEPFSIDESWLDVTGSMALFGDGKAIADELRERVKRETGLTISVGVSYNKVFAKLASDYRKPDATTIVSRENVRDILYPLPVSSMLYVGRATEKALSTLYIHTIGELAAADRRSLTAKLGKIGGVLHDYAVGLDDSPVRPFTEAREIKSVGNGITFRRNLVGWEDIRVGLLALTDEVARRLRREGLTCHTVQVLIKDPELRVITRQAPLSRPTDLAGELFEGCVALLQAAWDAKKPIRMLAVTALGLSGGEEGAQLSLFTPEKEERRERRRQLEETVDGLRERFGRGAVLPGSVLKNDLGIALGGKKQPDDGQKNLSRKS